MKAFDELKKSSDSNFRFVAPPPTYLAPKSPKIAIFGTNCRESELEGTILTQKSPKNSDSEVENNPAVVFWAKNALRPKIKRI